MNTHHSGRSRVRLLAALAGAGLIAVLVPAAHGGPIQINNDFTLVGAGPPSTTWDPDFGGSACETNDAYSPVDDGAAYKANGSEMNDAFDGGLLLQVGGDDFAPPQNSNGDRVGNLFSSPFGLGLRVGPRNVGGLRVVRDDVVRAKGSPTMRSLVTLRNTAGGARARNVIWESDLGSDGSTLIQRTSSGDKTFNKNDRWVVTSDDDDNANLDDPPVTHVLYGKGKVRKVTEVHCTPGGGSDDLSVQLRVKVPGKSVRYLLFFTEMNTKNDAAVKQARKFNQPRTMRPLLKGLSQSVRGKVVNWNL